MVHIETVPNRFDPRQLPLARTLSLFILIIVFPPLS
jgi:hypothetical protein